MRNVFDEKPAKTPITTEITYNYCFFHFFGNIYQFNLKTEIKSPDFVAKKNDGSKLSRKMHNTSFLSQIKRTGPFTGN